MRWLVRLLALLGIFTPTLAEAYIVPGAGAGTIAVVLGILSAVLMALVAIVYYPIKRLVRKYKSKQTEPKSEGGSS